MGAGASVGVGASVGAGTTTSDWAARANTSVGAGTTLGAGASVGRAANPCPALGGDDQHILVTFLILGGMISRFLEGIFVFPILVLPNSCFCTHLPLIFLMTFFFLLSKKN